MKSLIHIIHPVIYAYEGETLCISAKPTPLMVKVGEFLAQMNADILHHRNTRPDTFDGMSIDLALDLEVFSLINNAPYVVTTRYGNPIPDTRPKEVKPQDWKYISKVFTKHSQLEEHVKPYNHHIFLGGAFEACLTNTVGYIHEFFRTPDMKFTIIDDLSRTFDEEKRKISELKLLERGIEITSSEEILSRYEISCTKEVHLNTTEIRT